MASPDLFALSRSTLNPSLYADIRPEDTAATLTIASLFGRCGRDPWDEAARLARLPVGAAVASLAAMIAGAPTNLCTLPEATALAHRLIALLPRPTAGERLVGAGPAPTRPLSGLATCTIGLGVVVVLVAAWLVVAGAGGSDPGTGAANPATQEGSP